MLAESIFSYRHPPRVGDAKLFRLEQRPHRWRGRSLDRRKTTDGVLPVADCQGQRSWLCARPSSVNSPALCRRSPEGANSPDYRYGSRPLAGAGRQQGNIRHTPCGGTRRRPLLDRINSRRIIGNAVANAPSELDHRRLSGPASTARVSVLHRHRFAQPRHPAFDALMAAIRAAPGAVNGQAAYAIDY